MKRMHWVTAVTCGVVGLACASGAVAKPTGTYSPRPTTKATVPAESHPAVPSNATGFCHVDGHYTTAHSDAGKEEQCADWGGVAG